MLSGVDDWTFDSFALDRATGGRPLSTLAFALIRTSGLMFFLDINEQKLARCLYHMAS